MTCHDKALAATTADFAGTYAHFAAGLRYGDLPQSTIAATRTNLFDTLSCSLAGFNAEGSVEVRAIVEDWGGTPQSHVLWTDRRLPAPYAAWINGVMSHARDYDDVHDLAIVHAGVSSVPAALAAVDLAAKPVSGEDFIAGLASGLELTTRMGVATKVGVIDAGFIFTSLFGYFGATAAAARIMGLAGEQIHNAMGITYSQAAGGHQVTRDWAHTKRIQPGFAARAALTSVAMSDKGVRGARDIFEGEDGLWRIYLRNELDPAKLREGLGARFHVDDLCYKPYPSCRYNHTAVDAALRLREQPGFDWRKITEIKAYATEQSLHAVGYPIEIRQNPETLTQAQFSICYNIACALVNGSVSMADFADTAALARPDIVKLTRMVEPRVDEDIQREWARSVSPTRIDAVVDGKTYSVRVDTAKGSTKQPFTAEDTRRKLEDCLYFGGFHPAMADEFEAVMDRLPQSSDVGADMRKLSARIAASRHHADLIAR